MSKGRVISFGLTCVLLLALSACRPSVRVDLVRGQVHTYIPEGMFYYGVHASNQPGSIESRPVQESWLPAYWISRTQVTNAQYLLCQHMGGCAPADDIARHPDPLHPGFPVVYVTWYDAQEYCRWAGGRLPSEAEWEKAARGAAGQSYPWGEEDATSSRARVALDDRLGPAPVGSYPLGASPYGVMDMGSNVREWVEDWFDAERKVLRGASWFDPPVYTLAYARLAHEPDSAGFNRGFRCVWEP